MEASPTTSPRPAPAPSAPPPSAPPRHHGPRTSSSSAPASAPRHPRPRTHPSSTHQHHHRHHRQHPSSSSGPPAPTPAIVPPPPPSRKLTTEQLEALFKSTGAFDRLRHALESRLTSRAAHTRAATERLIAANPNADPRWLMAQIPIQVIPPIEQSLHEEMHRSVNPATDIALQNLVQDELAAILTAKQTDADHNNSPNKTGQTSTKVKAKSIIAAASSSGPDANNKSTKNHPPGVKNVDNSVQHFLSAIQNPKPRKPQQHQNAARSSSASASASKSGGNRLRFSLKRTAPTITPTTTPTKQKPTEHVDNITKAGSTRIPTVAAAVDNTPSATKPQPQHKDRPSSPSRSPTSAHGSKLINSASPKSLPQVLTVPAASSSVEPSDINTNKNNSSPIDCTPPSRKQTADASSLRDSERRRLSNSPVRTDHAPKPFAPRDNGSDALPQKVRSSAPPIPTLTSCSNNSSHHHPNHNHNNNRISSVEDRHATNTRQSSRRGSSPSSPPRSRSIRPQSPGRTPSGPRHHGSRHSPMRATSPAPSRSGRLRGLSPPPLPSGSSPGPSRSRGGLRGYSSSLPARRGSPGPSRSRGVRGFSPPPACDRESRYTTGRGLRSSAGDSPPRDLRSYVSPMGSNRDSRDHRGRRLSPRNKSSNKGRGLRPVSPPPDKRDDRNLHKLSTPRWLQNVQASDPGIRQPGNDKISPPLDPTRLPTPSKDTHDRKHSSHFSHDRNNDTDNNSKNTLRHENSHTPPSFRQRSRERNSAGSQSPPPLAQRRRGHELEDNLTSDRFGACQLPRSPALNERRREKHQPTSKQRDTTESSPGDQAPASLHPTDEKGQNHKQSAPAVISKNGDYRGRLAASGSEVRAGDNIAEGPVSVHPLSSPNQSAPQSPATGKVSTSRQTSPLIMGQPTAKSSDAKKHSSVYNEGSEKMKRKSSVIKPGTEKVPPDPAKSMKSAQAPNKGTPSLAKQSDRVSIKVNSIGDGASSDRVNEPGKDISLSKPPARPLTPVSSKERSDLEKLTTKVVAIHTGANKVQGLSPPKDQTQGLFSTAPRNTKNLNESPETALPEKLSLGIPEEKSPAVSKQLAEKGNVSVPSSSALSKSGSHKANAEPNTPSSEHGSGHGSSVKRDALRLASPISSSKKKDGVPIKYPKPNADIFNGGVIPTFSALKSSMSKARSGSLPRPSDRLLSRKVSTLKSSINAEGRSPEAGSSKRSMPGAISIETTSKPSARKHVTAIESEQKGKSVAKTTGVTLQFLAPPSSTLELRKSIHKKALVNEGASNRMVVTKQCETDHPPESSRSSPFGTELSFLPKRISTARMSSSIAKKKTKENVKATRSLLSPSASPLRRREQKNVSEMCQATSGASAPTALKDSASPSSNYKHVYPKKLIRSTKTGEAPTSSDAVIKVKGKRSDKKPTSNDKSNLPLSHTISDGTISNSAPLPLLSLPKPSIPSRSENNRDEPLKSSSGAMSSKEAVLVQPCRHTNVGSEASLSVADDNVKAPAAESPKKVDSKEENEGFGKEAGTFCASNVKSKMDSESKVGIAEVNIPPSAGGKGQTEDQASVVQIVNPTFEIASNSSLGASSPSMRKRSVSKQKTGQLTKQLSATESPTLLPVQFKNRKSASNASKANHASFKAVDRDSAETLALLKLRDAKSPGSLKLASSDIKTLDAPKVPSSEDNVHASDGCAVGSNVNIIAAKAEVVNKDTVPESSKSGSATCDPRTSSMEFGDEKWKDVSAERCTSSLLVDPNQIEKKTGTKSIDLSVNNPKSPKLEVKERPGPPILISSVLQDNANLGIAEDLLEAKRSGRIWRKSPPKKSLPPPETLSFKPLAAPDTLTPTRLFVMDEDRNEVNSKKKSGTEGNNDGGGKRALRNRPGVEFESTSVVSIIDVAISGRSSQAKTSGEQNVAQAAKKSNYDPKDVTVDDVRLSSVGDAMSVSHKTSDVAEEHTGMTRLSSKKSDSEEDKQQNVKEISASSMKPVPINLQADGFGVQADTALLSKSKPGVVQPVQKLEAQSNDASSDETLRMFVEESNKKGADNGTEACNPEPAISVVSGEVQRPRQTSQANISSLKPESDLDFPKASIECVTLAGKLVEGPHPTPSRVVTEVGGNSGTCVVGAQLPPKSPQLNPAKLTPARKRQTGLVKTASAAKSSTKLSGLRTVKSIFSANDDDTVKCSSTVGEDSVSAGANVMKNNQTRESSPRSNVRSHKRKRSDSDQSMERQGKLQNTGQNHDSTAAGETLVAATLAQMAGAIVSTVMDSANNFAEAEQSLMCNIDHSKRGEQSEKAEIKLLSNTGPKDVQDMGSHSMKKGSKPGRNMEYSTPQKSSDSFEVRSSDIVAAGLSQKPKKSKGSKTSSTKRRERQAPIGSGETLETGKQDILELSNNVNNVAKDVTRQVLSKSEPQATTPPRKGTKRRLSEVEQWSVDNSNEGIDEEKPSKQSSKTKRMKTLSEHGSPSGNNEAAKIRTKSSNDTERGVDGQAEASRKQNKEREDNVETEVNELLKEQDFVPEDFGKQLKLLGALENVMTLDDAGPFLEPVERTGDFGQLYHSKIKNPMDLGTISMRIKLSTRERAHYQSVNDILKDVELVWTNCRAYNAVYDEVTKAANRCAESLTDMLGDLDIVSSSRGRKPRRRRSTLVASAVHDAENSATLSNQGRSLTSNPLTSSKGSPKSNSKSGARTSSSAANESGLSGGGSRKKSGGNKKSGGSSSKSRKTGAASHQSGTSATNIHPDNDGRLLGKTLVVFSTVRGSTVKAWYSVKVKSYNSKRRSYSLQWKTPEGEISTTGATFGLDMKFPVYRTC